MARFASLVSAVFLGLLTACSQVPEQSVTLSEDVGQVLEELRQKNTSLVTQLFDDRKSRINAFVDNVYGPAVVSKAMKATNAVARLKTAVDTGKGDEALKLMQTMVNLSLARIQKTRAELLRPIEKQQREVKTAFDNAFGVAIKGTETTTGLLRSIRAVDTAQNQILGKLGIQNLRATVNKDFANVSDRLGQFLGGAQKVDQALNEVTAAAKDADGKGIEGKIELLKKILGASESMTK